MTWDSLTWRQADASTPEGVAPIVNEHDVLRSALEEAASAMIMAPVTITGIEVAEIASAADLPDGFSVAATFELLGKERWPVAVALDPSGDDHLGASTFDPGDLGWRLAEALDQAVAATAGEGLQVAMADGGPMPDGDPLVLVRLTFGDALGSSAKLVAAMNAEAPGALGMHLVLVREMGKITLDPPQTAQRALAPGSPAAGQGASTRAPQASAAAPNPANVRPLSLEELTGGSATGVGGSMELLYGVNLEVTVEIGRTRLPIRDVLALTPGSIVELDKLAGEKVDVLVNGQLIASGEVVVVDENFGVRITEVSARARRLAMGEGAA